MYNSVALVYSLLLFIYRTFSPSQIEVLYTLNNHYPVRFMGLPGGAVVKNLPANSGNARDTGLIPGSRSSPGIENGNLL